jgi:Leucine-rich repeat (LRR) protein
MADSESRPDFFISRAGADKAAAQVIANIVREAKLTPFSQDSDFGGADFMRKMEDGYKAHRMIALLTPEYQKSEVCRKEYNTILKDDPANLNQRLIVLRLADCKPEGNLATLTYYDLVPVLNDENAFRRVVRVVIGVETLETEIGFAEILRREGRTSGPVVSLPYPSLRSLFKGRETTLSELRNSFLAARRGRNSDVVCRAIHGLGGIGKTRLAVEYAIEYQNEYKALLLVSAETEETLRRDLAALTVPLSLPERNSADEEARRRAVLNWLKLNPLWLLILDRLDSIKMFEATVPLLGQLSGGDVIITSQLTNFPPPMVPFELDLLDTNAAVNFLKERTERYRTRALDDDSKCSEVAQRVGHLALALEYAGAFISQERLTFSQYLNEWDNNLQKVMAWSSPQVTQYPRSLETTWRTSIDRLSDAARLLLYRLAWLSPEPIPRFLLEVPVPGIPAESLSSFADLAALSLVTRDPDNLFFSVHRLLQEVMRFSLKAEDRRQSLVDALGWIDAAFTGDPGDIGCWPRLDVLTPHALAVARYINSEKLDSSTTRLVNALSLLFTAKAAHAQREIELGFSPRAVQPLTRLELTYGRFEKALEPLEGLTSLQELSLRNIYVGDAAPLAKWVNLQRLDLGRSRVISVAPLVKLTSLRTLDLWRTKVRDAGPLANLQNLESLSLAHTGVADISPLASLQKLRRLDLSDTPVKDIASLGSLSNLIHLALGGTEIRDISVLARLPNLKSLDLSDTKISDITALAALQKLEKLTLNGTTIRDVLVLARLQALKRLDLGGTRIGNVSPLSALVNLEVLSLGGCPVEELAPLTGLNKLIVLNLGCTRIRSCASLAGLMHLRSLDLRGTSVRDASPLARLNNLENLDLSHTRVRKVTALSALKRLKLLHVEGNRVADGAALMAIEGLRVLKEI